MVDEVLLLSSPQTQDMSMKKKDENIGRLKRKTIMEDKSETKDASVLWEQVHSSNGIM